MFNSRSGLITSLNFVAAVYHGASVSVAHTIIVSNKSKRSFFKSNEKKCSEKRAMARETRKRMEQHFSQPLVFLCHVSGFVMNGK